MLEAIFKQISDRGAGIDFNGTGLNLKYQFGDHEAMIESISKSFNDIYRYKIKVSIGSISNSESEMAVQKRTLEILSKGFIINMEI